MTHYFVYKLIAPRPTFPADMSEGEAAIMRQHSAYWQGHLPTGKVLVFGQVVDPSGDWGLAVVEAESIQDVHSLGANDPAVVSGMATYKAYPMPRAIVRS